MNPLKKVVIKRPTVEIENPNERITVESGVVFMDGTDVGELVSQTKDKIIVKLHQSLEYVTANFTFKI